MTSLSLNAVRPGCRPGGAGITPALLSAGLPVDPVLCVRPVFTAFPRSPPQPFRWCSVGRLPLSPHLSLSAPLSRDDLFRVELDSVAGDEMFYSKVSRSQLDTARRGCTAEFPPGPFGEMRIVSEYFVFFFYRREHGSRTRTISGSAG